MKKLLRRIAYGACFALPILSIPLALLAPFFTSQQTFTTADGILTGSRYYDVTLLVVTVAVLMAAFLWLPLQRRARDRSGIFLAQLMIALFISGPTLFLYGGMREAALQEMDRQFLFAIGAAPDGLPSFGSYTNYMFGPGLSPGVALGLWLLLISIPAFNYYRYTVSKQRILGFKMKTLFQ